MATWREEIQRAVRDVTDAELELYRVLRAASDAGVSLRQLARAANLSASTIWRRLACNAARGGRTRLDEEAKL